MSDINQESEQKLVRARELVDFLGDADVNVAQFKAISAVLDAIETMFNTLSRPIVVDPSMFMGGPPAPKKAPAKKKEPSAEQKMEERIQAMQDKQYI